MPSDWPMEALKTQAIAARSEAYRKLNRHKEQGYDFCSGVHCQVYSGAKVETKNSNAAIDQTEGLVAFYNDEAIDAVYSNSCGGHTQGNIFGNRRVVDYLKEKQDSIKPTGFYFPLSPLELEDWLWSTNIPVFCNNEKFSRRSNFRWQRLYTKEQLQELIRKQLDIGGLISIDITERLPSSHVHRIKITGTKGEFLVEKELNIRKLLGNLRSGMFNIDVSVDKENTANEFLFYGGGWGHGVGMCQVGAATMADHGFNCSEILKFYYSGINIRKLY
jgi:SpoIID/LytB domain protein